MHPAATATAATAMTGRTYFIECLPSLSIDFLRLPGLRRRDGDSAYSEAARAPLQLEGDHPSVRGQPCDRRTFQVRIRSAFLRRHLVVTKRLTRKFAGCYERI